MIDLRSDTLSMPTEEMLQSILTARLGDDSRDGDPTVLASASLQGRVELHPALSDEAPGGLRFLLPPSELKGRLD